jgi:AbrB family looped-hinge helix DNA binding protein
MRITSKGQVTIPQAIREQTGLLPNTDVEFVVDGGDVKIIKSAPGKRASRGQRAVARLRDHGGAVRMTTDEILALTRGDP